MMKMITFSESLFLSLLGFCFISLVSGDVSQLPEAEVQALKDIGKTLGKTDWNFNTNSCSGQPNWVTSYPSNEKENNVTCNCTVPNDKFCHVAAIILKAQNLQGKLPTELIRLPYLQHIDLTRNYLHGTIPKEWGALKLLRMDLLGNRLSGVIPAELGNITTLQSLVLEFNNFSGNLPPELGNLTSIERLFLTSNNFTGELPETFSRLTKLKDVRLGDNQFSGSIPNFIQRWTNLQKLVVQGSGFSGPIPKGISFLQDLTDLRISDLKGPDSTFPPIENLKSLTRLILRSCNINDELPEYLGYFTDLKILDLSFNKLRGGIPVTWERLRDVDSIYLTGNLLTGPVHKWTERFESIDLSYNNFSNENPDLMTCQELNMNLFASFAKRNNSGPLSCGKNKDPCLRTFYSFHINCGGNKVAIGNTTYDEDTEAGPAISKRSGDNWAFSSTGHILDNDHEYKLIENSPRMLNATDNEVELYMNARVSPISLTYYGFCLANGNYTVKLHFAEIMFTDDNTFNSLGRRVFDVYIQGKRVLKDFNIKNEPQGVGKAFIKPFPANVTNNDLEIRFYWAGKGTTALPYKSVYGSLISAISVTSDFPSPSNGSISTGVVVGIVVAVVVIVILVVYLLWLRGCLGKRSTLARELKGLELQTGIFTLRQITAATNNFDISNKIGEGGFGPVYKGTLLDGTTIAVKQLSSKSKQGNREFINEIGMISALQHPHLVKLYGCCVEGDQLLLVYEYMENNSLAHALFGPEESRLKLNWPTRHKICVGIARGLAFLHEESRLKIVHRDIKATNVLLDKDLNPKISDFGLAKLDEEDNTHISTRIAGTYGYMAPEYAMHGYLTDKADVYSFGIVALEIVSGKTNTSHRPKGEALYLLNWAHLLRDKGNLMELVDPRLGSDFNKEEAMVMIKVALLCTNVTANLRPSMSSVVSMLEGRTIVAEFVSDSSEIMDEIKLEIMREYYNQIGEDKTSETQTLNQSLSTSGPWTASSSSAVDLYSIHLDSSYWEKRN